MLVIASKTHRAGWWEVRCDAEGSWPGTQFKVEGEVDWPYDEDGYALVDFDPDEKSGRIVLLDELVHLHPEDRNDLVRLKHMRYVAVDNECHWAKAHTARLAVQALRGYGFKGKAEGRVTIYRAPEGATGVWVDGSGILCWKMPEDADPDSQCASWTYGEEAPEVQS